MDDFHVGFLVPEPLVKMKMMVDFFIGHQSVGHTFIFALRESDAGVS